MIVYQVVFLDDNDGLTIAVMYITGVMYESVVTISDQALADVGLPNGKTDLVELDQFTFDKFYKIYQTICPRLGIHPLLHPHPDLQSWVNLFRNDIDELFRSITGGQRDMIDCAK